MKFLILLVFRIIATTDNNGAALEKERKENYSSFYSSYKIMNVKKLKTDISEIKDLLILFRSRNRNFKKKQSKLLAMISVHKSLSKMFNIDELSSMNEFEKNKLRMDIKLLKKI